MQLPTLRAYTGTWLERYEPFAICSQHHVVP
jgi:hypothetical protein